MVTDLKVQFSTLGVRVTSEFDLVEGAYLAWLAKQGNIEMSSNRFTCARSNAVSCFPGNQPRERDTVRCVKVIRQSSGSRRKQVRRIVTPFADKVMKRGATT